MPGTLVCPLHWFIFRILLIVSLLAILVLICRRLLRLFFYGVELNRPQVRRDWNDYSDDELVEKIETDCPKGVVTFLVDAPLANKDISLPKTI